MPAPLSPPPPAVLATLVARSLTLDRGGSPVFDGISLTVGPSSHVGVVGPNGVGKSSLLQVLSGTVLPDSGRVVRDPPSATVGYLDQEHADDAGGTVREVLARRVGGPAAEAELAEPPGPWPVATAPPSCATRWRSSASTGWGWATWMPGSTPP